MKQYTTELLIVMKDLFILAKPNPRFLGEGGGGS